MSFETEFNNWMGQENLESYLKEQLENMTEVEKEDAFYRYSRDKTFYTVFGTNADNQKIYAIVSKNGKKINIYGQEDGISAETAKKAVRKRQDVKKITNVGMGMKGKTPVWEVTYLNAYGNLCYDIIAFKNGDIIKTIQNI